MPLTIVMSLAPSSGLICEKGRKKEEEKEKEKKKRKHPQSPGRRGKRKHPQSPGQMGGLRDRPKPERLGRLGHRFFWAGLRVARGRAIVPGSRRIWRKNARCSWEVRFSHRFPARFSSRFAMEL
jgi:hypothetical protein